MSHQDCCSDKNSRKCCGQCGCNPCCCHSQSCHEHEECCSHEQECGHEGDFSKMLLELADEAWMEVLKNKIMQQIEKSEGKKLDELAKLVSDANGQRWQHKLAKKKACEDFSCKLKDFFCHKENKQQ